MRSLSGSGLGRGLKGQMRGMAFFSARLRFHGQDFGRLFGDGHGAALAFAVDPVHVRIVDLHEDFDAHPSAQQRAGIDDQRTGQRHAGET